MKKLLSLVLCISVILSVFAFDAVAEGETGAMTDENIYYVTLYSDEKLDFSIYEGLEKPFDFYGVPINGIELRSDFSSNGMYVYSATLNKNDIRPPVAKEIFETVEIFWSVILDDPNAAVFELDFTENVFKSELTEDFQYTVIRTSEELENFLLICKNDEYSQNEFVEYASTLPENYFNEKAIFITKDVSESGAQYRIDRIYVEEASSVYMEYSYIDSEMKPDDIVTYLITAEINQSDIKAVEYARALMTVQSEDNINFDYQYFGDVGWNETDKNSLHGKGTAPTLVQNFDELKAFVDAVSDTSSASFEEYASTLPENYFDENALLLVRVFSTEGGYSYYVTSLTASEQGLKLGYSYGAYECYDALSGTVIAVEFKKSDAKSLETVYASEVSDAMMIYIDYSVPKPESTLVGDVNGDGKITADDYIVLKRIYFGTSEYTSYGNKTEMRSDIDGNGKVDADDYILLKRVFFGTAKLG